MEYRRCIERFEQKGTRVKWNIGDASKGSNRKEQEMAHNVVVQKLCKRFATISGVISQNGNDPRIPRRRMQKPRLRKVRVEVSYTPRPLLFLHLELGFCCKDERAFTNYLHQC
eukprot:g54210.t1